MYLLVGCPVQGRTWILPSWFNSVEESLKDLNVAHEYVFTLDKRSEETYACVTAQGDIHKRTVHIVDTTDDLNRDVYKRDWDEANRIYHMAGIRNGLLSKVRELQADLFLSLDSDILLNHNALPSMVGYMDAVNLDAVGGKCYLGPGTFSPNYAHVNAYQGMRRQDLDWQTRCDAIMAIKLMKPEAYKIDYEYHAAGEDIGWSMACKAANLRLGWDGTVVSKHVMSPEDLDVYDKRCGY